MPHCSLLLKILTEYRFESAKTHNTLINRKFDVDNDVIGFCTESLMVLPFLVTFETRNDFYKKT